MITAERKAQLQAAGYEIEDMGAVWGDEFKGNWRWMLNKDQDWGDIEYSEADAWSSADQQEWALSHA